MNDIQLAEVCQRIAQNPSIHFVFGRQGSGKTRIAEKMSEEKLGVPMFSSGIASGFHFGKTNPEIFWVYAAISALMQSQGKPFSITRALMLSPQQPTSGSLRGSHEFLLDLCGQQKTPATLLVDSVDLIPRDFLRSYVESLFDFVRITITTKDLAAAFRVVVFCRPETKDFIPEDMEQLAHSALCVYL